MASDDRLAECMQGRLVVGIKVGAFGCGEACLDYTSCLDQSRRPAPQSVTKIPTRTFSLSHVFALYERTRPNAIGLVFATADMLDSGKAGNSS